MLITPELICRIEQFSRDFNQARADALQALPGNPYGVETRTWDELVAHKFRSPLLRGKNRIANLTEPTLPFLNDAFAFYAADNLRPNLSVPQGALTENLFRALTARGYWSGGTGTVPALVPGSGILPSAPPQCTIHVSPPAEQELYLDLFQESFGKRSEAAPDYRRFQWTEDSLPGAYRYIAEWNGKPVAMASLITRGGVGYFGTAGVIPSYRKRGIQQALLAQRVADAASLGINLLIGGGSLFSTTHRNFERAGMSLVPLGSGWTKTSE